MFAKLEDNPNHNPTTGKSYLTARFSPSQKIMCNCGHETHFYYSNPGLPLLCDECAYAAQRQGKIGLRNF